MADVQIDLLTLFGIIEVLLVLLVVAAVFILRSHSLSARVRSLRGQLKQAADAPPAVGFDQYLRDEVLRNQAMFDAAAASSDPQQQQAAQWLGLRRQCLNLELAAREFENNPVRFQETLLAGFGELAEQLRPPADAGAPQAERAADVPPEVAATGDPVADETPPPAGATRLDTHEQEFDRLKRIILNQQDAMKALRSELRAREEEFADIDGIMRKLDEFEQHDAELQQCLRMLEEENQRLKSARAEGSRDAGKQRMDPAQLDSLKTMIGNQQATIGNLQKLIQELTPEAGKATELAAAVEGIQRANQELNSCVAVLEDENAMLRAELDAVNAQLQHQEEKLNAVVEPERADSQDGEAEEPPQDDEKEQLLIKVQELEALVEFKDAAIEELERQYNSLESKYLAQSGEK